MGRNVLLVSGLALVLAGCGSDRGSVAAIESSNGVASISGDAVVGEVVSASVSDSDGVSAGTESYQWYANGSAIGGATSDAYVLTAEEGGDDVSVVVRYTDSAGLRETVESAAVLVQSAFTLSATYVHGLVDGASCTIAAIDALGDVGDTLSTGTTVSGVVNFAGLVPVDGASLITCTGGTYTDEASGATLDAPDSRAVVDVQGDSGFTVSPLTEIAVALAAGTGDLNSALTVYNTAVAVKFAITGDITDVTPTDLATTAATNDNAGRYATALALVSQLDDSDADSTAGQVVAALVADLGDDGVFADDTVSDLSDAATELLSSPVGANLDTVALTIVGDAISNVPEPAVFGNLSASVANDATDPLTGSVTVSDVNFGEDTVVVQSLAQTTYGVFSIGADGTYTYDLDTTDATVSGLDVGESVNDVIQLASADGTTAALIIRITALTQVAEIRNTINGDTGELRLNLEQPQRQGKLKFSFLKTIALADDGNEKDAYVALYGSSGSSSESLIDLRIQGSEKEDGVEVRAPRFLVRNTDNAAYALEYPGAETIEAPFTANEWYDIEILWDMDAAEQLTVLINGEALGGGAFSTAAVVDGDFTDLDQWFSQGVKRVQWRFGDNGSTIPFGSYNVDDVEIYADTAGTQLAFSDDFEANAAGDALSGAFGYATDTVDASVAVFDRSDEDAPVPAAFFDLAGATDSDNAEAISGTITVIDPDEGEAGLEAQQSAATEFGTFSVSTDGAWVYTLDTTNSTIAALVKNDRETDTITVTSTDGTTADFVVTINGVGGETNTGTTNVAVIIDTTDDTGELRYKIPGDLAPLAAGRVDLKIKRLDDDFGNGDAFITLFNENTNNDGALLDFRIKDDSFAVRNPSSIDTTALPFRLDAFMDVRITWAYPNGDLTLLPLITISVDGVALAPFTPGNPATGGLTHIAVRFGDNSGVREATGKVSVDDFAIYSDTTGFVEVFSDDFESYSDGDSLDTDNPASPYNSSTSEATVEEVEVVGSAGPGTPGNQFAEIRDTDTTDTGELRYKLDAPLFAGRLEVAVKRLDDAFGDLDAAITLYTSSGSTSSATTDLKIKDNAYEIRSPKTTPDLPLTLDEFMDVIITWTYPQDSDNPVIVISIDGVTLDPITTAAAAVGGVDSIAFRFGDNGKTALEETAIFSVDDIAIYSDITGDTLVFEDDFESYSDGDSLDDDNGASPYNDRTSEATVGTEPELVEE